MKRLALALTLALVGVLAFTFPASAWPSGSGCTTYVVKTQTAAGWKTLVKVRRTTVCRTNGYITGVSVKVRRYYIARTA